MNNASISRSLLLPTLVGAVVGLGAFFLVERAKTRSSAPTNFSEESLASAKSLQEHRRNLPSKALQLAEKGNPSELSEFVEHWLALHPDDQDYIVGQLSEWYFDDADKYYEFARDFCLEIFTQNRPQGLNVISMFPRDPKMRNIERHVLNQWVGLDQNELLTTLSTSARENLAVNTTHLYQLVSIYGEEKSDQFDQFISWVHELDQEDSGLSDLKRGAYEALSFHCPADYRPELYAHLMEQAEENELFRGFPALVIGRHTVESPEEAVSWLEDMEPGPWKDEALFRFLDSAGEHQPLAGANLMNREQFMLEFAVPWEETAQGAIQVSEKNLSPQFFENFYDATLERFLTTALSIDPDLVFESADAFYNTELKNEFQAAAKTEATGGFTPVSAPPQGHSCGPNCTHEHH